MSDFVYHPIARGYTAMMRFCLRHRWIVFLAIVGSCMSVPVLAKKVGGGFLPPNDEAQFEIYVQAPEGTTLEATTLIGDRIARRIRTIPEVDSTLLTVAGGDQRQSNVGNIYVHLTDPETRSRPQEVVMEEVRKEVLPDVPKGTRVAAQLVNDFSIGGQNAVVMYIITGPDLDRLEKFGKEALADIGKIPGVADLDSSLLDPVDETTAKPDLDRAAMLGVDPADITATLSILVGGMDASTFEDRGDQYPVRLRAGERFRNDPSALALIAVPSHTLGQVPLADVIKLGAGKGTSKISRNSRERSVSITCNVSVGFDQTAVGGEVAKILTNLNMPAGYTVEPFGQSKELGKMKTAFMFAIGLAFAFMYLVLAAQFESWIYPLIIMLALPLTLPFAMMSLLITGGSLNIFSMLGLIVLFAVVKKNAILQVDHANGLRRTGLPRTEAVLTAAKDRLRPILMTTAAFVAGMMPLITSKGIGSGFSKAMASIVVGGQTLSLLLTLVAIPVIYTWFDDAARGGRWMWRKIFGQPERSRPERGRHRRDEMSCAKRWRGHLRLLRMTDDFLRQHRSHPSFVLI